MQRYFVHPEQLKDSKVIFQGDDYHHIRKVMRFVPGDQVIASNGIGRDVVVELTSLSGEEGIARVVEEIQENRELPVKLTLAQGLAKGEKMDWIVQKATEMGVHEILSFSSSRTIVKLNDKKEANRIARWQKIAKEAAEQSHRSRIPLISEVTTYQNVLKEAEQYDLALIAYEGEQSVKLPHLLKELGIGSKILLIIGPEGGFSSEEVALAQEHGLHSISLGKRILRTETAGIVALAYCGYHFEHLHP